MSGEMEEANKKWAQVMEMIGRAHEQRGAQAHPTKAEVLGLWAREVLKINDPVGRNGWIKIVAWRTADTAQELAEAP